MADLKAQIKVALVDAYSKGIGKAKKAISGLGSVAKKTAATGIAGFTAGLGLSIKTAQEQERRINLLSSAYKKNAGQVGLSWDALNDHANSLQANTIAGNELTQSSQALLLTFKNVRNEAFLKATEAAIDMTAAMNDGEITQSGLQSATIQLGKALNDPINGMSSLSRVGVSFTEEQKQQIRTLQESGRMMDAQTIILKELESEFGGTAKTLKDSLQGQIQSTKNDFGDLQEQIGGALIPVLRDDFFPILQDGIKWLQKLLTPERIINFAKNFQNGLANILTNFKIAKTNIDSGFKALTREFKNGFEIIKIRSRLAFAQMSNFFGRNKDKIEQLQTELNEKLNELSRERLEDEALTSGEIARINEDLLKKLQELEESRVQTVEEANQAVLGTVKKTSDKIQDEIDDLVDAQEGAETDIIASIASQIDVWGNLIGEIREAAETAAEYFDNILFGGALEQKIDNEKLKYERQIRDIKKEFARGQIDELKRNEKLLAANEDYSDSLEDIRREAESASKIRISDALDPLKAATRIDDANRALSRSKYWLNEINREIETSESDFFKSKEKKEFEKDGNVQNGVKITPAKTRFETQSTNTTIIEKQGSNGGNMQVNVMLNEKVLGRAIVDLQKRQSKGGL